MAQSAYLKEQHDVPVVQPPPDADLVVHQIQPRAADQLAPHPLQEAGLPGDLFFVDDLYGKYLLCTIAVLSTALPDGSITAW